MGSSTKFDESHASVQEMRGSNVTSQTKDEINAFELSRGAVQGKTKY